MNITKERFKKSNLQILSFFGLTFIIQKLYKICSGINYLPIHELIDEIHLLLINNIANVSAKIISNIFNLEVSIANNCELCTNLAQLKIYDGCSGFQQIVQFVLFFALIKGRMLNKLWFIPVSVLIIHLTNVIRMVGLFLILHYQPEYYELFHLHLFRVMFYAVIFVLWVIWVEKVSERKFKIPNVIGIIGGT